MFESAIERAGLELTIDCPPLPEPVYVDREMWAKIVLNLLSNALKFTFEGGITVRVEPSGETARLTVADTGIGIDPAEQPQLFERFHRVAGARSRSHEGSGIGLALVAELAELHGGAAGVESVPGQGSTFSVDVPFGSAHLPAEHVSHATDGAASAAPAGRGLSRRGDALARRRATATARACASPRSPARRGCSSSTTTPTCATTSRRCSPAATRSRPPPTAPSRSSSRAPTRPTSSSPT